MMLAERVELHDVVDVEAFVHATLNASGIQFGGEERGELVAEGLCLMCQLAASYQPRRGEHTTDGRFSGYAARYLPRRLGDAWHRLHPEHRYVTKPDGKREWRFFKQQISLEGFREEPSSLGNANGRFGARGDYADQRIRDSRYWVPVPVVAAV